MVLYLRQFQNPDRGNGLNPGNILNITMPGSPGIAVFQDHYGGHYIKKKATHVMMLWKYKPLNQDDAL
jgi:hypothetical protein